VLAPNSNFIALQICCSTNKPSSARIGFSKLKYYFSFLNFLFSKIVFFVFLPNVLFLLENGLFLIDYATDQLHEEIGMLL